MIQSVRDLSPAGRVALAFFDQGCTAEQVRWVRSRVDHLERPGSEPVRRPGVETPDCLNGLLARPFLRRYFPGYETYVWIDADAWVQEWRAVELLIQGAERRRGLAIVPEIDRADHVQYGRRPEAWKRLRSWYAAAFGDDVAETLFSYPLLNAGVFALHRDAPHWQVWAECLGRAAQHTLITDQLALNVAVYRHGLLEHTELLPAWCNWTCHFALPRWDPAAERLVEPYLPHVPIGILHLTMAKHEWCRLTTTTGTDVSVCLRYPAGIIS